MRIVPIRIRTSDLYLSVGLLHGTAIGFLGLVGPGGGLQWFLHVPTSQVGLPLSLALIGTGATLRRLEHRERASVPQSAAAELMGDQDVRESTIDAPGARRDPDRAL